MAEPETRAGTAGEDLRGTRAGPPTPRPAPPPEETEEQRKVRDRDEQRAMREQAEALTRDLPRVGDPRRLPLKPSEVFEEGEDWVTMVFPHTVVLTLPGYRMVKFVAGIQQVPARLADDPYLKAHGARRA